MNSTTAGPLTYPVDPQDIKIGMTVRLGEDDFRTAAADADDGTWNLVRITYTDGTVHEYGTAEQLHVVVHAAMSQGTYWAAMHRRLVERVEQLADRFAADARELADTSDKTEFPGVRAARAFEIGHCEGELRKLLDP